MLACASCHKFIKASKEVSDKAIQHILVIMRSGGTIRRSDNRMYYTINNAKKENCQYCSLKHNSCKFTELRFESLLIMYSCPYSLQNHNTNLHV